MSDRIDFILHWLWTLTYGLLAISGVAMIGAKYGWILEFNLSLADYIHRVSAAIWSVILLAAIAVEIYQRIKQSKNYSFWLIVGTKDYQLFTLFSGLLFFVTGMIIWGGHHSGETISFTFGIWIHEVLTFIGLASVIWHLYDKSHALLLD